jgi:uncharacterized protein
MNRRITAAIIGLACLGVITMGVLRYRQVQAVQRVVITTGAVDGEYYGFAQALAVLVERHNPRLRLVVEVSQGSAENFDRLQTGQADFAIVQNGFPSRPRVLTVAQLFPEVAHLIVRQDSGIRSIADLRGKRVALMPKGSGSFQLFWAIGRHYNLGPGELTALPQSSDRAYAALGVGQVDALFRVIAPGSGSTQALLRRSDVELLPLDQGTSLQLAIPYLESLVLPKGTYDGSRPIPPEDLPMVGVRSLLVARSGVAPEVVQSVTQILFDKRNELMELYPRAAMIQPPPENLPLMQSFHEGAKAYYNQEQPSFLDRNSDVLGLLFSVGTLVVSGGWQLRIWLLGQQKDRADRYNLEILELLEQLQGVDDLPTLQGIREQLLKILREVVEDLDNDRITAESFQSFAFPWEMAIVLLHQRELLLLSVLPSLERG